MCAFKVVQVAVYTGDLHMGGRQFFEGCLAFSSIRKDISNRLTQESAD